MSASEARDSQRLELVNVQTEYVNGDIRLTTLDKKAVWIRDYQPYVCLPIRDPSVFERARVLLTRNLNDKLSSWIAYQRANCKAPAPARVDRKKDSAFHRVLVTDDLLREDAVNKSSSTPAWRDPRFDVDRPVTRVELASLSGKTFDKCRSETTCFAKVYFAFDEVVGKACKLLRTPLMIEEPSTDGPPRRFGFLPAGYSHELADITGCGANRWTPHEGHTVPIVTRFSVDAQIGSGSWFELDMRDVRRNACEVCSNAPSRRCPRCKLNTVDYDHLFVNWKPGARQAVRGFEKTVLLRPIVHSFDIEVYPARGPDAHFPHPTRRECAVKTVCAVTGPMEPVTLADPDAYLALQLQHEHTGETHFTVELMPMARAAAERRVAEGGEDAAKFRRVLQENLVRVPWRVFPNTRDGERALLRAHVEHIRARRAAVVTGWNIDGFDVFYCEARAKHLDDSEASFHSLACSFVEHYDAPVVRYYVHKRQFGQQQHEEVKLCAHVPGLSFFDMMQWTKNNKKFPSNTLGFVSQKVLKTSKIDFDVKHIAYTLPEHEMYGKIKTLERNIVQYCAVDASLPFMLMLEFKAWTNTIALASKIRINAYLYQICGSSPQMLCLVMCGIRDALDGVNFYLPTIQRVLEGKPSPQVPLYVERGFAGATQIAPPALRTFERDFWAEDEPIENQREDAEDPPISIADDDGSDVESGSDDEAAAAPEARVGEEPESAENLVARNEFPCDAYMYVPATRERYPGGAVIEPVPSAINIGVAADFANEPQKIQRDMKAAAADPAGAEVFAKGARRLMNNQKVATLDFQSLYPSIIMVYNICFSTLIKIEANDGSIDYDATRAFVRQKRWTVRFATDLDVADADVLQIPMDFIARPGACPRPVETRQDLFFLGKKHFIGVLPRIMHKYLSERQSVKGTIKRLKTLRNLYASVDREMSRDARLVAAFCVAIGVKQEPKKIAAIARAVAQGDFQGAEGAREVVDRLGDPDALRRGEWKESDATDALPEPAVRAYDEHEEAVLRKHARGRRAAKDKLAERVRATVKALDDWERGELEDTSDSVLSALDALQLALKLVVNSSYGGLGAQLGALPGHSKSLARAVTAMGRFSLHSVSHVVENTLDVSLNGILVPKGATEARFFAPQFTFPR